jgi:hypothetical protein
MLGLRKRVAKLEDIERKRSCIHHYPIIAMKEGDSEKFTVKISTACTRCGTVKKRTLRGEEAEKAWSFFFDQI